MISEEICSVLAFLVLRIRFVREDWWGGDLSNKGKSPAKEEQLGMIEGEEGASESPWCLVCLLPDEDEDWLEDEKDSEKVEVSSSSSLLSEIDWQAPVQVGGGGVIVTRHRDAVGHCAPQPWSMIMVSFSEISNTIIQLSPHPSHPGIVLSSAYQCNVVWRKKDLLDYDFTILSFSHITLHVFVVITNI